MAAKPRYPRPSAFQTAEALRAHVADQLADYKVPRKVFVVDDLRRAVSQSIGVPAHVAVGEVRKPDLDAKLVRMIQLRK